MNIDVVKNFYNLWNATKITNIFTLNYQGIMFFTNGMNNEHDQLWVLFVIKKLNVKKYQILGVVIFLLIIWNSNFEKGTIRILKKREPEMILVFFTNWTRRDKYPALAALRRVKNLLFELSVEAKYSYI